LGSNPGEYLRATDPNKAIPRSNSRLGSGFTSVEFDLHLAQRQLTLQAILKALPLAHKTAYRAPENTTYNAEHKRRLPGLKRQRGHAEAILGPPVVLFNFPVAGLQLLIGNDRSRNSGQSGFFCDRTTEVYWSVRA